jgi:equilibrative nucleoside transporter 1/2/3
MGSAGLVAWNALLTTFHYFDQIVYTNQRFVQWATFLYFVAIIVTQLVMVHGMPKTEFFPVWSLGVVTTVVCMGWIWLSHMIAYQSMGACLVGVAGVGFASSLLQSSLTGLVGVLPTYVMGATMAGQGVAGVLGAIVSPLPQNFGSVGAIIWGANATVLVSLPIYFHHLRVMPEVREVERRKSQYIEFQAGSSPRPVGFVRRSTREILCDAAPQALNVFGVFFATFVVFPGVSSSWVSSTGIRNFVPIATGFFQVGDVVGRVLPSYAERVQLPPSIVRYVVFFRAAVFVPCFLWMRGANAPTDAVKLLAMLLFAVSNGYTSTLAMMYGPLQVAQKSEREVVGYIMSLALVSGITVGSVVALVV